MKKVILSFALLSASALSVMAQSTTSCNANAQCAATAQCDKKAKCEAKGVCPLADGKCGIDKAFDGINLSEDQKTKLAALKTSRCAAKETKKEGKKAGERKEKPSKEDAQKIRKERAEKHQNARKEYLVQVKEILTPDQYVMFLENSYTLQGNGFNGAPMRKVAGKKKDMKGPHRMKDVRGKKVENAQPTNN